VASEELWTSSLTD
jgi:hypothetical protein